MKTSRYIYGTFMILVLRILCYIWGRVAIKDDMDTYRALLGETVNLQNSIKEWMKE